MRLRIRNSSGSDELDLWISVDAGSVDAQQLALAFDRDFGIVFFDHFTGFACDVRLVFLDLFSTNRSHRSIGPPCAPDPSYADVLFNCFLCFGWSLLKGIRCRSRNAAFHMIIINELSPCLVAVFYWIIISY